MYEEWPNLLLGESNWDQTGCLNRTEVQSHLFSGKHGSNDWRLVDARHGRILLQNMSWPGAGRGSPPELRRDGAGEHVTVNLQLGEQRQRSELPWDAAGEGVVVQGERPQVPEPRPDLS